MIKRVFLIVLDSLGIGHAPDAALFGDEGSDTLCAISSVPGFRAETLAKLGLFKAGGESFQPELPAASYARMTERSAGKDTTVGLSIRTAFRRKYWKPLNKQPDAAFYAINLIPVQTLSGIMGRNKLGQESGLYIHQRTACSRLPPMRMSFLWKNFMPLVRPHAPF